MAEAAELEIEFYYISDSITHARRWWMHAPRVGDKIQLKKVDGTDLVRGKVDSVEWVEPVAVVGRNDPPVVRVFVRP